MNEKGLCPFKMAGNRGLWDCEKEKCQFYMQNEGECTFRRLASPEACFAEKEREPECLKSDSE